MKHAPQKAFSLKKFVTAAIATGLLATSMAPSAQAKELLYSLIAPGHPLNEPVFGKWASNVATATEGRVTVRIMDTAAAPAPRLYDATRTGVVDASHTFIDFLGQAAPLIQLSMLPMISESAEANAVALSRTYAKFIEEKETLEGVKILGFLSNPGGVMCSLKEPIDSSDALKALKMWSLPGYAVNAMKAMDVPVVAGPATEMYALVSKGTVDGFNGISIGDAFAFKTAQYAKSCTMVKGGVFTPVFAVMINQGTWDALDDADKAAIESVSGEAFARLSSETDGWNEKVVQAFKDQGGEIIVPSDAFNAELTEKWAPMHAAWIETANAAGLDGLAVYDYYKAQVAAVLAE